MDYLIRDYRAWLLRVRCHPEGTVDRYLRVVEPFLRSPYPMTAEGIECFLADREDRAPWTVHVDLSALKSFCRWMVSRGLLGEAEAYRIGEVPSPKIPKRIPQALQVEEMAALLDARPEPRRSRHIGPDKAAAVELRDTAVVEMVYATGNRRDEVVQLQIRDIVMYEDRLMATVQGKGRKQRCVYGGRAAQQALLAYLPERRHLRNSRTGWQDPEALFVGARLGRRLDGAEVHRIVSGRGKAAGIPRVFPHLLRSSFATHLLRGGMNLRDLQALMGHESITSTEAYLAPAGDARLQAAYAACHPRK